MRLFSPSPTSAPHSNLAFYSSSPHPSRSNSFFFRSPSTRPPPCLAPSPPPVPCSPKQQQQQQQPPAALDVAAAPGNEPPPEKKIAIRRPAMDSPGGEDPAGCEADGGGAGGGDGDGDESDPRSSSALDAGLSKFAERMPIFEPERVGSGSRGKPLPVNLDLALYRAKVLARSYKYVEAQEVLERCISHWPEDGRAYVTLGKILCKQSRTTEARAVYEKGCQAAQGENPYIWQCWAVLEDKLGNVRRARELFDAATVADKRHIAAWHGWAVLELKQGNVKKARHLLAKGLKNCGGNEYIYQTLARLEVRSSRYEQARYLFKQATKCNPKSCASWLAWAQMEMQLENNLAARLLFERAVQASPKNRFAWHVWGLFEANMGNIEKARKLLKIGHTLNPRDPVLLQSLALLEYKHSTANLARVLFRRASELDPKHQAVWIAWGWMEWKEGNMSTARKLYQRALSINSTTESAARCLQAWGVLEQRIGNLSAARRLFRSSLNINSQSYITWMTWASLEEDQGNSVRAEEIRNLYFQQRTELVDDASWVTGFLDIIDPALDSFKRLLNLDQNSFKAIDLSKSLLGVNGTSPDEESAGTSDSLDGKEMESGSGFDLDAFVREKLSLEPAELEIQMTSSKSSRQEGNISPRRIWRSAEKTAKAMPQLTT
ncbi:protein high chlorophyll fluorescent 107 [Syzygium oleosum]|uniref:protein high chlorophyll fluorescent 107 n=1 Tax=Syzygium oleosum TaxID=219896 RepID=UPI0011D2530F|nr:protein high chlorophyll fluorescent 107 [Syzygium oleosum]